VVFPLADETNEKRQLRVHEAMVDLQVFRQQFRRDRTHFILGLSIERELPRQGAFGVVLQRTARRLKDIAVAVGSEIRRRDRVEEKMLDEKAIPDRLEALDRANSLGTITEGTAVVGVGATDCCECKTGKEPRFACHF
jgi:hypothetical protein